MTSPSRSVVYARDHGVTLLVQLRPSTWSHRYHRTLNIMEACGSRPSCHELKASISVVLPSFSQLWVFTVGTPKYLAKKVKSKGLQRLRWYCQVCQKQCRDNGFKCHTQSEAHLRQMLVFGENAGRDTADYSSQLQHDFVQLLSRRYAHLSYS